MIITINHLINQLNGRMLINGLVTALTLYFLWRVIRHPMTLVYRSLYGLPLTALMLWCSGDSVHQLIMYSQHRVMRAVVLAIGIMFGLFVIRLIRKLL